MYSSNPFSKTILSVQLIELDIQAAVWDWPFIALLSFDPTTYNDFALDPEFRLFIQPDWYALSTLEKSKYKILQRNTGIIHQLCRMNSSIAFGDLRFATSWVGCEFCIEGLTIGWVMILWTLEAMVAVLLRNLGVQTELGETEIGLGQPALTN